ncbi:hypothetical protein E3P92_01889 [Wallemia ichthyophaga]|uniref:C2H2-type domain-containing protein n=2 Tax=Wallemia ichthyophaga TaxID=245174 RepID=A0A4T0HKJ2_WALIC|nr:Nutrient and stress factor 1 [Wallemia ichthyophaga EXF-994]TIA82044.1 hypothetical protein E3P98_01712 [Wallemia ichthyophaga]EOR02796.1 Nutrient and stress factor 1 [Wallemia ichthyophaga EXF-994]TIB00448.1 hypothetical protein E3P95_01727 [Wallemia ichthyophaga]TIB01591.1 hypothetical protein E3P94_01762 [Wallemia ichthyophaga]TIB13049.1 hypothetical protein E3P90_01851 [Wallemia ichthyophaga]
MNHQFQYYPRGYYVDNQQHPFYYNPQQFEAQQQQQQQQAQRAQQPPQPPQPQQTQQLINHQTPPLQQPSQPPLSIQEPLQDPSPPKAQGRRRKADTNHVGPQRKPRSQPSKLFQCTGYGNCSMQFTRSEHLARHVRKHTGERPFKCHCGKAFSRLDNLRQHAGTVHADQPEMNDSLLKGMSNLHSQLAANASEKQVADAQVVDRRDGSAVPTESQRGRKRQTTKKLATMSSTPSSSPIPTTSAQPPLPQAHMTHTPPTDHIQHRPTFPNQHIVLQGNGFNWSSNMYQPQSAQPLIPSPAASIQQPHQSHPMLHSASMPTKSHPHTAYASSSAPIMDAHPSNSSTSASSAAPPVLEEWSPHNQTPAIPHALRPTPTSTPIPLVRDTPESIQSTQEAGRLPSIASVVEQHQHQQMHHQQQLQRQHQLQHHHQMQQQQQQQQQEIYQAPLLPSPTQTTTYKPHSSQGHRPSTSEYFTATSYFDPTYQIPSNLQPLPFRKNSFQSNGMFGYQPPSDNQPNQSEPAQQSNNNGGTTWDEYSIRPRSSRKSNVGFNDSVPYLPPPSSAGIHVPFGSSRPVSSSEALRPLSSANNESSSIMNQNQFNQSQQASNVFKFDAITRADGEEVEEEDEDYEEYEERPDTNASRRQSILDLCGGEAGPRQNKEYDESNSESHNVLPPLKNVDSKEELIGLGIKQE